MRERERDGEKSQRKHRMEEGTHGYENNGMQRHEGTKRGKKERRQIDAKTNGRKERGKEKMNTKKGATKKKKKKGKTKAWEEKRQERKRKKKVRYDDNDGEKESRRWGREEDGGRTKNAERERKDGGK